MAWWLWTLVLASGCHLVFGVAPGDDALSPDGGGDAPRPPPCESYFTSAPVTSTNAVAYPRAMRGGKFDDDALLDLAVASGAPGLAILKANGDGTFGPAQQHATNMSLVGDSLAVGDLDGDADDDVVMGSKEGGFEVFEQAGAVFSMTFDVVGSGGGTVVPALFSYTGDALVDLALAMTAANEVQLFAQARGGFTFGGSFPTGEAPVQLAALNLDLSTDAHELVTANQGEDGLSILRASNVGMYDVENLTLGRARGLAVGKVDADAYPDLVVVQAAMLRVILAGDPVDLDPEVIGIPSADIIGVEIAELDGAAPGALVLLDRIGRVLVLPVTNLNAEPIEITTSEAPLAMAIGDATGDGRPDLVVVDTTGNIYLHANCR